MSSATSAASPPPGGATPLRRTPLDALHRAAGATMVDFAGWSMPLRYGSEAAEHQAVRTTGGLFDLSHMGEIELTGPEAAVALDHAVVSDLTRLVDGRAKYTLLCAPDGGILDDLIVYRLAAEHWLVVANAANAGLVAGELAARSAGFSAVVEDRSADWAMIALQGPRAAGVLAGLTDCDLAALRYYTIAPGTLAGAEVLLARTGYTGEDGFEVMVRPDDAARVWERVLEEGKDAAVVPAGLAARDTLRLEAGMPLYGHELSRTLTPYDAGLGRVVALEAPVDFVGRDALAARAAEPPTRRLVGLVSLGRRVPRTGYPVLSPDGSRRLGEVTSGAPSPILGRPVAMAYLDPDAAEPATVVAVDVRGSTERAEVVGLPFYRRPAAATQGSSPSP